MINYVFLHFYCKVFILNGGEIILLTMALKQKNQSLSFNNLILVPQTSLRRETTSNKYKILPNLKSNNSETQVGKPIDFTYYGRLKNANKLHPSTRNTSNLFMEGGAVVSIQEKQKMNQKTQMDDVGVHQNQRMRERIRQRIFLDKQSLLTVQKIEKGDSISEEKIWKPKKKINFTNKTMQIVDPLAKNNQRTPQSKLYSDKPSIYLGRDELSQIKAQSFVVLQYPNLQIITGLRHRQGAQIASLTKIMTFFTIWQLSKELQINLQNCKYQVDEQASQATGTSAGLAIGDQLTVQQLLYGLMLPSGNDAALSLAKWAGSLIPTSPFKNVVDTFVARMNRMARIIGLRQSVFANPHGLPHRLGSSNPYQIALLVAKCLQIPLFRRVVGTKFYRAEIINGGVKKTIIWENTNKLLGQEGFIGVKTGVTITAGPCLASCYEKGSKRFIVVLLRTNKLSRRFKQTKLILGWALRRYDPFSYGAVCKTLLRQQQGCDSQSEDEQQFSYSRLDAQELARRSDILVYQL